MAYVNLCRKRAGIWLMAGIMSVFLVGEGSGATLQPESKTAVYSGLSVSGEMIQDKVLQAGDGRVTVALTLTAPTLPKNVATSAPAADLVVVLDRSGSMGGQKIEDSKNAILGLLNQLGPEDRLGLVAYDDQIQTLSPLVPVTGENHQKLRRLVSHIRPGGGTNLGGGLEQGIRLLADYPDVHRQQKVILVSDGHANYGVTDPVALGQMASMAVKNRFSVSTLGVGLHFNELLMTTIADHGAGTYHFLEDPASLSRVFESELFASRQVAVTDVGIEIQVTPAVQVISASGYPLSHEKERVVFYPGSLVSGQNRTFYITFQIPATRLQTIDLGRIQVKFFIDAVPHSISLPSPLTVTCVSDPAAVMASIRKDAWGDQVVRETFNQLKAEVAEDIRQGKKETAEKRIQTYRATQERINSVVKSAAVTQNLSVAVKALQEDVDQTFAGDSAAVAQKRQQTSKTLQHESYQQLRDKK